MAASLVDARGRSCPEPVIMTKNAIEQGFDSIEVIVDSEVAKENVSRLAMNKGYKVVVAEMDEDFKLTIKR